MRRHLKNHWVLDADGVPRQAATDDEALNAWIDPRRQIARDDVGDILVSTVFLVIDHNISGGKPVLFETMVFGGALDGEQERYETRAAAESGHATLVERVRNG